MSDAKRGSLMIVDDEVELMRALCDSLDEQGYSCRGFNNPAKAIEALRDGDFDLLLSDLMMPEMDGIQVLKKALEIDPNLVGIIMTGQGTIQTAVEAMKSGAFDYILKPFRIQAVLPILDRAMSVRRLKMENVRLKSYLERLTFESARYRIIGDSPATKKMVAMIEKVAPSEATVLIRGPSGAGKELVARALHVNSPRRNNPLVTVNCATLQESLLESELFGHEKGAFTGAITSRKGRFEMADGGTLFLDEIGDMSMPMQVKLLRVLQERSFERVGGNQTIRCNVRVIAATHRNLEENIQKGAFREDLFYRLNVFPLEMPPLRERLADLPELVDVLTQQLEKNGRGRVRLSTDALAALSRYRWPGNVRELANLIERLAVLNPSGSVRASDLPARYRAEDDGAPSVAFHSTANEAPPVGIAQAAAGVRLDELPAEGLDLKEHMARIETALIKAALERSGGVVAHAAQLLGLRRTTLVEKLRKYGLGRGDEAGMDAVA